MYTDQQRREAVAAARAMPLRAASHATGIPTATLHRWVLAQAVVDGTREPRPRVRKPTSSTRPDLSVVPPASTGQAANNGWWQPGQSGNPSGRPKLASEFRDLARLHAPAAIALAVELMRDTREAADVRLRAAQLILDRALGKPTQPIGGEDGAPIVVSGARQRLEDALDTLRARVQEAPPDTVQTGGETSDA